MTTRRGFIGAVLASAVAPAIITTPGLLMPVRRPIIFDYRVEKFRIYKTYFDASNYERYEFEWTLPIERRAIA